ncbi:MAG: hypothetical protein LBS19_08950 [Clostridiales bacterium]|jgi:dsDNA-specific endonuclease/ATPase MutS2|nr:hypothetical protein [Clostridiales bacterium]
MVNLNYQQKKTIGAAYVLDKLNPSTPYGRELVRGLAPFRRGEEGLLERELRNAAQAAVLKKDNAGTFYNLLHTLSKFRDIRGSLNKLKPPLRVLSDVELFEVKGFLISLNELIPVYNECNGAAGFTGIGFIDMTKALDILDPDKSGLRSFYVSELYSEKLRDIRREKKDIEARLNAAADGPERVSLTLERMRAAAAEDAEELNIRERLTELLAEHKESFFMNIAAIARLDFTLAKAELAVAYNCVMPVIAHNSIVIEEMYSPEADDALKARGRSMMPVSIALSPGVCILTGANMGGKSVALKTLALNAYLFQCGLLVFAKSAALPLFDAMDFIMGDESSVWTGLSSFGAEIAALNGILERAGGFSLIILDEPAKGTNPEEGRAVAAALAKRLNGLKSISVIATHYDNVATTDYRRYATAGLKKDKVAAAERLTPELIPELMDYRLVEVTQNQATAQAVPRDALTICKLLGLDAGVIELIEGELGF